MAAAGLTPLDFCFYVWIKSEVFKIKVDSPVELLASNVDAAGRIKKRED
jgi:hypothetical protein